MKKVLALITAISIMFSLSACSFATIDATEETMGEKEKPVVLKKSESKDFYADDGTRVYSYKYDYLETDDEKYPNLAKKFDDMLSECEKGIMNISQDSEESYIAEMVEAAKAHLKNNPETFTEYSDVMEYTVERCDEKVLSILRKDVSYWGGAHSNSGFSGININCETGEELTLDNITKDTEKLTGLIYATLLEKYGEETFFDNMKDMLDGYIAENVLEWTIDDERITFWFEPYMLAPYAAGVVSAEVNFADYPDLF